MWQHNSIIIAVIRVGSRRYAVENTYFLQAPRRLCSLRLSFHLFHAIVACENWHHMRYGKIACCLTPLCCPPVCWWLCADVSVTCACEKNISHWCTRWHWEIVERELHFDLRSKIFHATQRTFQQTKFKFAPIWLAYAESRDEFIMHKLSVSSKVYVLATDVPTSIYVHMDFLHYFFFRFILFGSSDAELFGNNGD